MGFLTHDRSSMFKREGDLHGGKVALFLAALAVGGYQTLKEVRRWDPLDLRPPLQYETILAASGAAIEKSVTEPTPLMKYDERAATEYLMALKADALRMITRIEALIQKVRSIKPIHDDEAVEIASILQELEAFKAGNAAVVQEVDTFIERGIEPVNRPSVITSMYEKLIALQDGVLEYSFSLNRIKGVDDTAQRVVTLRD